MPSHLHEAIVALFRARPSLIAEVLRSTGQLHLPAVPASVVEADATELAPIERRADLVVRLGTQERPVVALVFEAQLTVDGEKHWSWPGYLATLRARLRTPVILVVLALDPAVARWARTPIPMGHPGYELVPVVLSGDAIPEVTEEAAARANPELAVLSAMAHGHGQRGEHIARAALAGVLRLDEDRAVLYAEVVLVSLSAAAREALEAFMILNPEYQSPFDKVRAEGRNVGLAEGRNVGLAEGRNVGLAEGRCAGLAEGLLTVLGARGLVPSPADEERIRACTDPVLLDRWLARATTAEQPNEVFVPN